MLGPSDFLEAARRAELIIDIDRFVLVGACRQVSMWQERHPDAPPLTLSVNLSARQFERADLTSFVKGVLKTNRFDAASLNLEITEDTAMLQSHEVLRTLHDLRSLGIQLSIDDFGTGYSSLSYLSALPVSTLKIDRSFVDCLERGRSSERIVATIVDLAHNLNMTATAEGIETEAHLETLRRFGCDLGQGYYFSKPVPWSSAERQLERAMA